MAFFQEDNYFEKIKLKSGRFLNENSDPNDFLSTIKTDDKHQIGQLEIFHNFDPIEIRPMIAGAKTKDIKGTYTLNGRENAERFKKTALEYGFVVEISREESPSFNTPYPYQDMIYKASIILCLLIALAMLYDVINNYKEIAVRYMLGYNFWSIGAYLFKRYIKVFLGSLSLVLTGLIVYLYFYNDLQQVVPFLNFSLKNIIPIILTSLLIFMVTWIVTKTINISQMIKNKKPIKLLFYVNVIIRFILVVFLTLGLQQGSSTFFSLKSTFDKQEKWSLLKDYSYLGIIADFNSELLNFQSYEKKQQFRLFYEELESQGAFFISPSNYYLNNLDTPLNQNPWGGDGTKVEINKNYLLVNPIIGIDNEPIQVTEDTSSNEITVLVPIKFEKYENDIKKTISTDYTGVCDENASTSLNVNIVYVKNDQSYFSFSTSMAEKNNYEITDPIAVIVNSQFDPRDLANNISMGYGYYTKNSGNEEPFKATQDTLKKYKLDEIW
ncbi:MAG: hypothetical protein AB6733_20830 [Clostridiaceae bacterium]